MSSLILRHDPRSTPSSGQLARIDGDPALPSLIHLPMGASGEYGGTGPPEQAGPFGPGTPAYVELQVQGTSLTYPCQRSGAESTDQRADQAALQAAGRAGIEWAFRKTDLEGRVAGATIRSDAIGFSRTRRDRNQVCTNPVLGRVRRSSPQRDLSPYPSDLGRGRRQCSAPGHESTADVGARWRPQ